MWAAQQPQPHLLPIRNKEGYGSPGDQCPRIQVGTCGSGRAPAFSTQENTEGACTHTWAGAGLGTVRIREGELVPISQGRLQRWLVGQGLKI